MRRYFITIHRRHRRYVTRRVVALASVGRRTTVKPPARPSAE